ncbi:MAG: hypothetical protein HY763_08895 [Planctomycetes bacterium]|nr:hypothetical protein [Planctomycetota bacterium]
MIQQEVLLTESAAVDWPVDAIDAERLRREMRSLCDRAAAGVQRAGLDLDDVTMHRWLVVRRGGNEPRQIPFENRITEPPGIAARIAAALGAHGDEAGGDPSRVVALRVEALRDRYEDQPDRSGIRP